MFETPLGDVPLMRDRDKLVSSNHFQMKDETTYRIFPLGDSAITVEFGDSIDETINKKVMAWFKHFLKNPLPGIKEIVPAYSSLTLHYDVVLIKKIIPGKKGVYEWMKEQVEKNLQQPLSTEENAERLVRIPVCYEKEFAADIEQLAEHKNISIEQVIQYHQSKSYRVYMLGFLPGFAYLGQVDDHIRMSRKAQPVPVAAGSIGIAGNQTGIYPMISPGGWQIIGRTPLQLFDVNKEEPALLKPGDTVQFYSISRHEFENY